MPPDPIHRALLGLFAPALHHRARHLRADRFRPLSRRPPHHRIAQRGEIVTRARQPAGAFELGSFPQPTRRPRVRLGVTVPVNIIVSPRIRPAHAIARRPPIGREIGPHVLDRFFCLRARLGSTRKPRQQRQRIQIDPIINHRAVFADAVPRRELHPRVETPVTVLRHVRAPQRLADRDQAPRLHHENIRVVDFYDVAAQTINRVGHHFIQLRAGLGRQLRRLHAPQIAHELRCKFHGVEIHDAVLATVPLEIPARLTRRIEILHRARPCQRHLHALRMPTESRRFDRKTKQPTHAHRATRITDHRPHILQIFQPSGPICRPRLRHRRSTRRRANQNQRQSPQGKFHSAETTLNPRARSRIHPPASDVAPKKHHRRLPAPLAQTLPQRPTRRRQLDLTRRFKNHQSLRLRGQHLGKPRE